MIDPRINGAENLGAGPSSTLVAIGNFDGVHRGHQRVLESAAVEAHAHGLVPIVLTFHPHPIEVLGRGTLEVLTPVERKVALIAELDPRFRVVVEPFRTELARMTPREFAEALLVALLGAARVIVGRNFRFGHQRAGDLDALVELGRELGFQARAEPLFEEGGEVISSSRIRAAIKAGSVENAARWLGRPHGLSGTVVHGDARGRTLGTPTANLDGVVELLPLDGVYACRVGVGEEAAERPAVANLGVRPTVDAGRSIEVHLLNFDRDLYGKRLRVDFVDRLREERRFDGVDALCAQIGLDIAAARRVLG